MLAAPNYVHPFKLKVDAGTLGAGTVFLQEDECGVDDPICYFSRKFKKHHLHFSTIEKEALALLLALLHFKVYLRSSLVPTIVFFNHNLIVFLNQKQNSNQCLMHWSLLVQDFNIEIRYKKGLDNIMTDALSHEH